jgi:transcriptional regulator of arginine metabolism
MNTYALPSAAPRSRRLTILAQILEERPFASQASLVRALARTGFRVTQATLSRDLASLGVVKRPAQGGGRVYALPHPASETYDRERQLLDLRAFVNAVRTAGNLVVVKTPPGHAHAVGRAIDLFAFDGCVGCVAGDDTVLVIAETPAAGRKLRRDFERIVRSNGSGT